MIDGKLKPIIIMCQIDVGNWPKIKLIYWISIVLLFQNNEMVGSIINSPCALLDRPNTYYPLKMYMIHYFGFGRCLKWTFWNYHAKFKWCWKIYDDSYGWQLIKAFFLSEDIKILEIFLHFYSWNWRIQKWYFENLK